MTVTMRERERKSDRVCTTPTVICQNSICVSIHPPQFVQVMTWFTRADFLHSDHTISVQVTTVKMRKGRQSLKERDRSCTSFQYYSLEYYWLMWQTTGLHSNDGVVFYVIILCTCSNWLLLKVSLFKSFHPCAPSTSSHSRATTAPVLIHQQLCNLPRKVVLPLVISCSSICPFFCETIVCIFTITEIFAFFRYVKNHNAALPN
jgi:hypothetical protein